jgi:hypothetical protein
MGAGHQERRVKKGNHMTENFRCADVLARKKMVCDSITSIIQIGDQGETEVVERSKFRQVPEAESLKAGVHVARML